MTNETLKQKMNIQENIAGKNNNALQQYIKIIAWIVVNSMVVARLSFIVT